ncbi:MAG: 8-oxoguanine deaminase [Halanaerobium sp.]|nr:8-oxoguanine deaminase [Halanaerobium sp.]
MSRILLKNVKEIVTMDRDRRRLKGFDLLIVGNRVAKLARNITAAAEEIDAADYYLYPGLINTHHHFYQALTRNIPAVQEMELFGWLEFLYPIWSRLTPEAVYYSTLVAVGELLKTGCTTAVDHFYVYPQGQPADLLDREFAAAARIGIRFHGCRGSMSLSKEEGGLPPASVVQREEEILQDSRRVIEKFHDSEPFAMQRVVLAPCSPFSVSFSLLKESLELARDYGVQVHTHLAETIDEERFCLDTRGMRPLEYLAEAGWLGEDVWFAHGVHLHPEEIEYLARTGTGVAHCPISNQKLSSGVAPIPAMLKKGVPVGLAVDGSASNDASNMIAEMKTALLLHKLISGIASINAEEVLSLATNGGSSILSRPEIGSIEEGKAADMFLLKSSRLDLAGGLNDPVLSLLNTGISQAVDMTIVNGEIVVREGRLTRIDEERVISEANRIAGQMLEEGVAGGVTRC